MSQLVQKVEMNGDRSTVQDHQLDPGSRLGRQVKLAAVKIPILASNLIFAGWQRLWMPHLMRLQLVHQQLAYQGRPQDLFVASYPKSGTTWLQMIIYQLTTDGEMNIPHISCAIPHLENAATARLGEMRDPRMVKTHLPYDLVPKGNGRYLYIVREGLDVAVSLYYHYKRYLHYAGTFEEFFKLFLADKVFYGGWFKHVSDWLRNKRNLKLKIICYENLVNDLWGSIEAIAEFCEIEIDISQKQRILERCSFEFMRKHEAKFDIMYEGVSLEVARLDGSTRFLRNGKLGDGRIYVNEPSREAYWEQRAKSVPEISTFLPVPERGC